MRLWHYELLKYLPKSQLLSQKRECDAIWKELTEEDKPNHILINYIHEYTYDELFEYYSLLADEFERRGYTFNYSKYIVEDYFRSSRPVFEKHHTKQYLIQCFYNLQEKYVRGQKDFTDEEYHALCDFVRREVNNYVE